MSSKRARFTLLIVLSALLLAALPTAAQDVTPSYQALVRFEDQYHLWDVATGDLTLIPGLADRQWIHTSWSPDGAYLLVFPYGENNCCSGLYDVERQAWDTRTFGGAAVWSPTGNYIASTSFNENSAELILHDWDQGTERVLYTIQTYDYRGILSNLEWSPDEQAIFFVESSSLIGGNNNYARVIYLPLNQVYSVSDDFDTWYVAYSPLWSPTGRYLLISLQVTATEPFAGDDTEMGDLYLFDAHTGERHRITNTPFQYEASFGWSEDGETIIYVVPQTIEVSLTNALNLGDSVTDLNEIPEMPILQQQGFLLISTSSDEQWQVWKDDNCVMLSLNVETEASFQLGVSGQDCQPTLFIEWRPVPPPDTAD